MPKRAASFCAWPGCRRLTTSKYCDLHGEQARQADVERRKQLDQQRGSAASRGYDSRWRKAREAYLRVHPLCVECKREGRISAATIVDHRIPHRGDKDLFWDSANWQALCKTHHDQKTAAENGGFGNQANRTNE